MRYLLLFENFRVPTELADLAKGLGYDEFVDHAKLSDYTVLYRGMVEGDELEDDQFYAEWAGHAREYGEWVDGVVVDYKDIMHFDDWAFDEFRRKGFDEVLSLPRDVDYEEDEAEILKKMSEIYAPYFEGYKLSDAMYQFGYDEEEVLKYVYDAVVDSTERYEKLSMSKKNDFFIPLLSHYAKSKGKNIISFWGGDYAMAGGAMEYVVSDVSRYPKLSEIWKKANP